MRAHLCTDKDYWNKISLNGTLFHTFEWCMLMTNLPHVLFYPYLIEYSGGECILPVFEQAGIWSWSMLGYGGPSFSENHSLQFDELDLLMTEIQGSPTNRVALPPNRTAFTNCDKEGWSSRETHILNLPRRYEELWNSCSGKVRTSIRYAQKNGVEISNLSDSDFRTFYSYYYDLMTRRGAEYVFSMDFIQSAKSILNSKQYLQLGAFLQGELIAGSLFVMDDSCLYYWLHASHTTGRRLNASYLILQEAFRIAIDNSLSTADLGSSHTKDIAMPKEYWGAKATSCLIFQRPRRVSL